MSAFNLGGMGGVIGQAMFSWFFWLIFGIVIVGVVFGSLVMRRKGKFIFPAVILTEMGNGKISIKYTRAGWFKSGKVLAGLIEVGGERRLETKDGRTVQQGSSEDFHEINFKQGLVLKEKSDDPKILVPISRCELATNSRKMLLEIAPADYRDACSKIISDAEKESMSKWETIAQVMVFGFVGIILFISIILTIQYSKNTMSEAQAIHKEALAFYDKVLGRISTVPSTAP